MSFVRVKVPGSVTTIEHLQVERATLTAPISSIVVKVIKRTFSIYTFNAHLLEDISSQSKISFLSITSSSTPARTKPFPLSISLYATRLNWSSERDLVDKVVL
jgi:hypothetical protein